MEDVEGVQKHVHYFILSRCFHSIRPENQRIFLFFKDLEREK